MLDHKIVLGLLGVLGPVVVSLVEMEEFSQENDESKMKPVLTEDPV
jgi:hypothetical protein